MSDTAKRSPSWILSATRGAAAGAIATWLMDLVTTGLMQGQPTETTDREKAAQPNGKSSIENLVDVLERRTGSSFDDGQRRILAQAVHFGLGMGPGAVYAILRHRVPFLSAGRGLVFGVLLWAVNDEYLNVKLGLAAPAGAYPAETHWRGLVGHAVLGVATDAGIDVLGV